MLSKRFLSSPSSPIRKLVPFAQAAKKKGIHVYHLNIGDPDIKTPDCMLDVLRSWDKNPVGYSLSQGEPAFLSVLLSYYHSLGFTGLTEENLQVTLGGSEAIFWAMFAVTNPGDEMIVFEPFYANYNSYAALNEITFIPVKTRISNGFHLPPRDTIERLITKKTKAILFCSPNNPTGTVYTQEEMDMLVAIAKKHDLYLLSDEVYREFCYDGRKQISLLSYMDQLPRQAIVLDSMSKRYSACGARLGVLISRDPEIMAGALRLAQGRLSAGLVDQLMLSKLTEVPESYFDAVHADYQNRRDVLYSGLQKIPGVTCPKPEGAFYAIVGLPVKDAEDFCRWLLTDFQDNNETLMLAPAAGFYATLGLGKNEVRIAYVLNTKSIKRCLELLTLALRAYNSR